jgi:hypothetical protein
VALHRTAGNEHTARGGQRVYSHIAVLTDAAYAAFGYNPLAVHAALANAVGDNLVLNAAERLAPLPLSPGQSAVRGLPRFRSHEALAMAERILHAGACVLTGMDSALDGFGVALRATPAFARRTLAASVGLKFSPYRQMRLTLLPADRGETARAVRGTDVEMIDLARSTPETQTSPVAHPFGAWLDLARRWMAASRWEELDALTASLHETATAHTLSRIVDINNDLDALAQMDLKALEAVASRYRSVSATGRAEAECLERLKVMIAARRADFGQGEALAAAARVRDA